MTWEREILKSLTEREKTRGQIVIEMESRRTTIYDALKRLKEKGLVTQVEYNTGERGHPYVVWSLTEKGWEEINNEH
jgi:DNA-binding PadR family transcriptional regulator